MSFLNAGMMFGLIPLLAVPLAIHLLNKRFPHLLHFSSVRFIRATKAQRSRLFALRHLILLALRTLFLGLLLLAFLKPVRNTFGPIEHAKTGRQVLVVVDHSLSMEYRAESASARERAVMEAEKIIDTLGPDDSVNVMLVGQESSTCFVDFSRNHSEAKRYLQALKPGLTRADFNRANTLAARLLSGALGRAEVYYLSDFQRKNWANVDFTALPPKVRLFFSNVASKNRDNRGILEAGISQGQILAGDTVPLEVTVGNYSESSFHGVVRVSIDRQAGFEKETEIAPWSVGKVNLPVPVGGPGLHLCEVSLPADGLEADNHHFLTIPVLEKEEVLIVSDDPHADKDAVYFLKTALNPYENLQGSLLPKHITSGEISAARLAGVKKLFLTRLNTLSDPACAHLARYVFNGGGMVYFLDGPAEAANLARLEQAMGPGTLPLKVAGRRSVENVGVGAQQVVKGDFKSRYLKLFRGAGRQDLGLLEFYDYYQASSTGAGQVLLTYADESPALAATSHGLGTLLLANFSVGELSSNVARQRIFPAWIQDLAKAITSDEPAPNAYTIGEPVAAEIWKNELRDNDLRPPAGGVVSMKRESLGERVGISFVPDQAGFYTLGQPRPLYAFAANPGADESDLRQIDADLLPDRMKGGQEMHYLQGQEDYEAVAQGRPLFHYCLMAGAALLLVELGFQLLVRRLAT